MPANSEGKYAVIAGTGVAEHFSLGDQILVETGYGKVGVYASRSGGFLVLPRHGPGHSVPPHRINYRANIEALRKAGASKVIATSAVGSMNRAFGVGRLGLVGQFLDFTKSRPSTFFDDEVRHTDMTEPYSAEVNAAVAASAKKLGLRLHEGLVYVCADGPRFETAAEIKMFRRLGGDVVGMTGVPEVVLAKEAGLEYSSVVIATNWAAGMQEAVSHKEVLRVMKSAGRQVKELVEATVNARKGRAERR